ncbi:transmembrane protein 88a [Denticeps clupeoides]|uniref:Transmembrane protein 88 n=1 Tax=Denticeps clupeoides TaxID=299321 RepID=A0AAY4A2X3_9TELE|nr:transmembrane protein 88-like [Denticeps clupeoides]XP_028840396.1 transmembrane protein 88-like [Denticeps clupeoides]
MSLSRNGTLEKRASQLPVSELGDVETPPTRLQHANSISSGTAPVAGAVTGASVVVPPPYSAAGSANVTTDPPLELRGSLDCWACSVLVTAQNLVIATINAALAGTIFGLILTPAIVMVVFGFLCHSTVRPRGTSVHCSDLLTDAGCVALLVVGFLLVTPLLVLALAAYCRLARHLQLGLCFIPYSRAVYKNLPASSHRGLCAPGCCGQQRAPQQEGKGSVWV